jgi:phytoene synthase
MNAVHRDIFKKGSKTYFNSSLFFPESIRRDVFTLYGFVRVADDFVDQVPQDVEGFYQFKERYQRTLLGEASGDAIIDSFAELSRRKRFPGEWAEAFLTAMETDLSKKEYRTVAESLRYIYGSAEVIGLFMSRIMDLDERSFHSARMLGRAMQYINFIRDIAEDLSLGRRYLALEGTPLGSLDEETAARQPRAFESFIKQHLDLYRGWQAEAEQGYPLIPRRYRVAIKTAADMYNWTAHRIEDDPFIVFRRKVKPVKVRILAALMRNWLGV